MMREKWLLVFAALVTAAAVTTGGIALASSSGRHQAKAAVATPAAVRSAIAAFRAAPEASAADVATEESLKHQFAGLGEGGLPVGSADFADAHSSAISGSTDKAWIAPSGGDVCTYLRDPANGWGGGCYSLSSVQAGDAYTILGGGVSGDLGNDVVVAVVVPEGNSAPQVVAPDGKVTTLSVAGNVAAAVVPSDDVLKTGGISVDLSATVHPAKVRWVH